MPEDFITPEQPVHAYRTRDAFGRELMPGDEVIVPAMTAPRFRLSTITPELDPSAPPNTLRLILTAQMVVPVQNNAPVPGLVRVRTNAEIAKVEQRAQEPAGDGPIVEK